MSPLFSPISSVSDMFPCASPNKKAELGDPKRCLDQLNHECAFWSIFLLILIYLIITFLWCGQNSEYQILYDYTEFSY